MLLPWLVFDVSRCVFAGGSWNLASILVPLNLLIGGAVLLSLGIIGEYVGRIYTEAKRRPLFTVQEQFGLDDLDFACQPEIGHSWKSESTEQKVQIWSKIPDSPEVDEKPETADPAAPETAESSVASENSSASVISSDPENAHSQDAA